MTYDIVDIKNHIKAYVSSNNAISLGKAYLIYLNNQNEPFVENTSTLGEYSLDNALLCINNDTSFFETLLPKYIIIHKLLKQWYYDMTIMGSYYV